MFEIKIIKFEPEKQTKHRNKAGVNTPFLLLKKLHERLEVTWRKNPHKEAAYGLANTVVNVSRAKRWQSVPDTTQDHCKYMTQLITTSFFFFTVLFSFPQDDARILQLVLQSNISFYLIGTYNKYLITHESALQSLLGGKQKDKLGTFQITDSVGHKETFSWKWEITGAMQTIETVV